MHVQPLIFQNVANCKVQVSDLQWDYTEIYCNIFSCVHSYLGVHGLESWDCQMYYQNNFLMSVVACDCNSYSTWEAGAIRLK